jgi:hypothetical protein
VVTAANEAARARAAATSAVLQPVSTDTHVDELDLADIEGGQVVQDGAAWIALRVSGTTPRGTVTVGPNTTLLVQ